MPLSSNTKELRDEARQMLLGMARGGGEDIVTHDERIKAAAVLLSDITAEEAMS